MHKCVYSGVSLQNGRPVNMDSLLLKFRRTSGGNALLAVVCDGVGSFRDGTFASGAMARGLSEWFGSLDGFERAGLQMRDAALRINANIVQEIRQRGIQTASTLSAVLFFHNSYCIVHAGDSRVYASGSGGLRQLTCDDVSESGGLTAYIGQDRELVLQYLEGDATGQTFLLCSDGLYKRMDDEFLRANIRADSTRAAQKSIRALTRYVIERGEQDNISTALIKMIS